MKYHEPLNTNLRIDRVLILTHPGRGYEAGGFGLGGLRCSPSSSSQPPSPRWRAQSVPKTTQTIISYARNGQFLLKKAQKQLAFVKKSKNF